ncbi:MAG: tyrosine-type recombinase/integrase, partial [Bdellovibrionales bacterium]|nr:tyrosine-type recombinase/integrase [Bdellovibrionales bacterium]
MNQFLVWLKADQEIDFPLVLPQTKPPTQKIPNFLSVDECLSIITYIDKQESSTVIHQQRVLFFLLYGCGLRISEACNARSADVSLSKRQLKIMGKGQKERLVVLPIKVCEILKDSLGEEFIFGEKPLPTRTGYERIRQLGKASGIIKPLHPH